MSSLRLFRGNKKGRRGIRFDRWYKKVSFSMVWSNIRRNGVVSWFTYAMDIVSSWPKVEKIREKFPPSSPRSIQTALLVPLAG